MSKMLPMRFRMLHFLSKMKDGCVNDVYEGLKDEYGTEKYFNREDMKQDLLAMKENALLDEDRLVMEGDELLIYYKVNEEGMNLLKNYLPKEWKDK
ncbi:MAG: hypothetical protein ACRC28_11070 [Clostridium sp.]|uniref:hypothetical protein n=1 Tax=Clostridium sp. TaxID=1506 RepID=UPI003F3ED89B